MEAHTLPFVLAGLGDPDDETRGNAIYAVGKSLEMGSEQVLQHLPAIVEKLMANMDMDAHDADGVGGGVG